MSQNHYQAMNMKKTSETNKQTDFLENNTGKRINFIVFQVKGFYYSKIIFHRKKIFLEGKNSNASTEIGYILL